MEFQKRTCGPVTVMIQSFTSSFFYNMDVSCSPASKLIYDLVFFQCSNFLVACHLDHVTWLATATQTCGNRFKKPHQVEGTDQDMR